MLIKKKLQIKYEVSQKTKAEPDTKQRQNANLFDINKWWTQRLNITMLCLLPLICVETWCWLFFPSLPKSFFSKTCNTRHISMFLKKEINENNGKKCDLRNNGFLKNSKRKEKEISFFAFHSRRLWGRIFLDHIENYCSIITLISNIRLRV